MHKYNMSQEGTESQQDKKEVLAKIFNHKENPESVE